MAKEASALNFERAAILRDKIEDIRGGINIKGKKKNSGLRYSFKK